MSENRRSLLLVVSAPSGAGKSTLCDRLLADEPGITRSVSCTTRAPRGVEVDGRDYYFLTMAEFEHRVQAGEFLEHAMVHGNCYGTLRRTVEETLAADRDVLLVIDVQGAALVRDAVKARGGIMARGYVDIFVAPPSLEVLRDRLVKRAEDVPEVIERRLKNAEGELARAGEYQHKVINDDLTRAYIELRAIVQAEHLR